MDDSTAPLVTVVTPVFNGAACLQACIDSVRAQDCPGVEHVVVDGGSSDGTVEIVRRAGLRHVSERDAGIYDAMSKGVRMARGEYVHILNADDRYAGPGSLSRLVAALRGGDHDLVHARARQVREDGTMVREFGRHVPYARLRRKMVVAHPTVVVRRSVYERWGTFSVGFRIAADHEWVLRVWNRLRVAWVPEALVEMQVGGVSTDNANVARSYRESMAAAIIHGASPLAATVNCWYEIAKHRLFFSAMYADRAEPGKAAPRATAAGGVSA
jgi:glycosyltransferase involved in cell wall biosynthesis